MVWCTNRWGCIRQIGRQIIYFKIYALWKGTYSHCMEHYVHDPDNNEIDVVQFRCGIENGRSTRCRMGASIVTWINTTLWMWGDEDKHSWCLSTLRSKDFKETILWLNLLLYKNCSVQKSAWYINSKIKLNQTELIGIWCIFLFMENFLSGLYCLNRIVLIGQNVWSIWKRRMMKQVIMLIVSSVRLRRGTVCYTTR